MKKKTILCAVLATTLALGIGTMTACGSGDGGNKDVWWSTTGEIKKENGEVVFNDVNITLESVASGDDSAAFSSVVDDFNNTYKGKIKVKVIYTAEDAYAQQVTQKIQNDINTPDILMAHQKLGKTFYNSKIIQPMGEAYEAAGLTLDYSKYSSLLSSFATLDTDYKFGVPIDMQGEIVLVNLDLLNQLNKSIPTNRAEFVDVLSAAKTKWSKLPENESDKTGVVPLAIATGSPFFNKYVWPTALLQNGAELYNKTNYTADWTSATNKAAFLNATKSLDEFFDNGYSEYGRGGSYVNQQFQNGIALFNFNVPFSVPGIIKTFAANHNITEAEAKTKIGAVSIANLLAMDSSNAQAGTIYGDSHTFYLSNSVKDITEKAACATFVNYISNYAKGGSVWGAAGHATASTVIKDSNEYKNTEFVKNYIDKWYPDMDKFTTIGNTSFFSDYDNVLNALCGELLKDRKVWAKEVTFTEILTKRQTEINGRVTFDY